MLAADRALLLLAAPLALIVLFGCVLPACGGARGPIDGGRAYEHVRRIVEVGPRPSGSAELVKARDYIAGELKAAGIEPRVDTFQDAVHAPGVTFHNVEAEIAGSRQGETRLLVLGSHYDTKRTDVPDVPKPGMRFVGANDGGSSSGLLIEVARHFKAKPLPCPLLCVWFDGEESIPSWERWDDDRSLFGAKRCVQQLKQRFAGKSISEQVPAMVLLDMVGAKDLSISRDGESNPQLQEICEAVVAELGYTDKFFRDERKGGITDDHRPFRENGVKVLDLIQFGSDATGQPKWWHTEQDDMSLISKDSLAIVGHVVTLLLPRIAEQLYR